MADESPNTSPETTSMTPHHPLPLLTSLPLVLHEGNYVRPPLLSEMVRNSLEKEDLFADDEEDEKRAQEFYDMLKSLDVSLTRGEGSSLLFPLAPPGSGDEGSDINSEADEKIKTLYEMEKIDKQKSQEKIQLDDQINNLNEIDKFGIGEEDKFEKDKDQNNENNLTIEKKALDESEKTSNDRNSRFLLKTRSVEDDVRELCITSASVRKSILQPPTTPIKKLSTQESFKQQKSKRRSSLLETLFNMDDNMNDVGSGGTFLNRIPSNDSSGGDGPSSRNSSIPQSQIESPRKAKTISLLPPPSREQVLYYGTPIARMARSAPKFKYMHRVPNTFVHNEAGKLLTKGFDSTHSENGKYSEGTRSSFYSAASTIQSEQGGGSYELSSSSLSSSTNSSSSVASKTQYSYVSSNSSLASPASSCSRAVQSSLFSSPQFRRRRLMRPMSTTGVGDRHQISAEHRLALRESAIRALRS